MGDDVTFVPDNNANRALFDRLLDRDFTEWLPDILASAPSGVICVGHEGERAVLNPNLTPAFVAGPRVLAELEQRCTHLPGKVMGELVRPLIEVVSKPYSLEHDGFGLLRTHMNAWQSAIQTAARNHGAVAGAFGTIPWAASHFQGSPEGTIIDNDRYRTYFDRMPRWGLPLPSESDGQRVEFDNVLGIGPLTAHQFSIDVPADRLHDFVNAANIAVSLLRAWFPNGDTPYGVDVTPHDMRIEAFTRATMVDGVDRTFIGPRWARSPLQVFEDIAAQVNRRSIFLDATEKEYGSAIKQLLSSAFPLARVRFGRRGNIVTIYLEIRPLSGGPTASHEVSATAVGVGLIYYIASKIKQWTRFNFSHIKANFRRSTHGLNTDLFWVEGGQDFIDSAREIARRMLPKIRWALIELCQAKPDDVDEALLPARRVLETGITPTVWGKAVRADLRKHGCSPSQAVASFADYYLDATGHGASSSLVGDWRNPVLQAA